MPHYVTDSEVVNPLNPAEKVLAPGAEWERTVCALSPGIDPTSVSVKVDLLGFEDGSKWGPTEQDFNDWQGERDGLTALVTVFRVLYRCSSPRRATPTNGRTTL